jgi:hypothetical protein
MPGMMPPLQLSLGSSASSDAKGGSASGGGMGALNEGDWIIQVTGNGDNGATTTKPQAASSSLLMAGAVVLAAWLIARR